MIPKRNVAYLQKEVDKDVQTAYRTLLEGGDNDEVRVGEIARLKNMSGMRPEVSEEIVDKAYNRCVNQKEPIKAFILKKAFGTEGPDYEEADVQRWYDVMLKTGRIEFLEAMEDATGIAPRFDDKAVQKGYETMVLCAYEGVGEDFEMLRDVTGVVPDVKPETVQEVYAHLLHLGLFSCAEQIERSVGIKPDAALVQREYEARFRECTGWILECNVHEAKGMKDFTGIEPDPKLFEKYPKAKKEWFKDDT